MFLRKIFLAGLFSALLVATGFAAPARATGTAAAAKQPATDAPVGEITYRCAFWERPADDFPVFYVRESGRYKVLAAFAMSFGRSYVHHGSFQIPVCRKATAAEIEQRKAAGVKKADLEYVPLFSIDTRGRKDVGVIFLPGKWENKPANEVLVFDWGEKSFPYGTIRVANFSGRSLVGQMLMRGSETPENFRLKHSGIWTSPSIDAQQRICEIQLAALVDKKPQVVYSSAATFYGDSRTMIFIIPDAAKKTLPDEAPKLDFRAIKERRPLANSKSGGGKSGSNKTSDDDASDSSSSSSASSSRRSRK